MAFPSITIVRTAVAGLLLAGCAGCDSRPTPSDAAPPPCLINGTDALPPGNECDGGCFNLQGSQINCGACGHACEAREACIAGACVCAAPMAICSGVCVNLDDDPSNCGACGHPCNGFCRGGRCCVMTYTCGCATGLTPCGTSACVDTAVDPANCGGCGVRCAAGTACVGGTCPGGRGDAGTDA